MSIKSYILHYDTSKKLELVNKIEAMPSCELIPAENQDLMILVTDTETDELDKELESKLLKLDEISHLSLVSGFDANNI